MEINGIIYRRFSTHEYAKHCVPDAFEILYRPRHEKDPAPFLAKVKADDMVMFDAGNSKFDADKIVGADTAVNDNPYVTMYVNGEKISVERARAELRNMEREHSDMHLGRVPDSTFAENIVCFIIGMGVACFGMWLMHALV